MLVVDDASPDGTGELADKLAAADERVQVLHRAGKAGLGAAYLAGFARPLQDGYQVVVEMDADGSHAPEDLPALLAALDDADLVHRLALRARRRGWSTGRRTGSGSPAAATSTPGWRWACRSRTSPAATGRSAARCWRSWHLADVASQGYCFQVDMAWRAVQAGFRVREVPITFTERERGSSKMSHAIVAEALWRVTRWGPTRLLRRGAPDRSGPVRA